MGKFFNSDEMTELISEVDSRFISTLFAMSRTRKECKEAQAVLSAMISNGLESKAGWAAEDAEKAANDYAKRMKSFSSGAVFLMTGKDDGSKSFAIISNDGD